MKKMILTLTVILFHLSVDAQSIEKSLPEFKKVVISPFIEVELIKGPSEGIKIVYENVEEHKINIDVKGKTLRVYLDGAKFRLNRDYFEGRHERYYSRTKIKAVITYQELENIQIAGNNRLTCKEELKGNKLKIKVYGQAQVEFASLETKKIRISTYGETSVDVQKVDANKMRVATYGDNDINIVSGLANSQTYRAYGDNTIDAKGVRSTYIKVGFFGDNKLAIDADHEVRLTVLGEGDIQVHGDAYIRKNLVLGEPKISSL